MASEEPIVSLKELLEAGVHFGHQVRRWHPKMKPYIYTTRDGVHIFDLEITARKLTEAAIFLKELGSTGKTLLMVGTKRQAVEPIKQAAGEAEAAYINKRWIGGLLTNWDQVSKNFKNLIDLEEKRQAGQFSELTKLEQLKIDRQITQLDQDYGGLRKLAAIPDAVFILDVHRETTALREALRCQVTVVAVCDTNADPEGIDYVIPGNDDAAKAIALYCQVLGKAYGEGKKQIRKSNR